MRSLRQRISVLKNKISDTLSDDNDLFGYLGISKVLILDSLSESYNLLSVLEGFNDKFETIFAKRNVAGHIDNANNYLNNAINTDSANEQFNVFLYSISQIRYILKEAYLTLTETPLRLDTDIAEAKEILESLSEDLVEIRKVKDEIDKIKSESAPFIKELESKHRVALENDEKISLFVENVESIDEELDGTNEKIKIWKSEIQTIKEDISNKQVDIVKLKNETEQIKTTNKENQIKIDEFSNLLEKQLAKNKEHQDYIQKTIEDVSRAGMAGSFKKRKDELKWTQWIWAVLTVVSVGGLVWLSYSIVKPILDGQNVEMNQLLIKIPVFASAVWLGWFCSKQYGFTSRIREDYSYKYAISLAFEGYKNETSEIDEELLHRLIELTIMNISKSPVSNFDSKSNHGTPYNEIVESVSKRLLNKNESKN